MIIQVVDEKTGCQTIFSKGRLHKVSDLDPSQKYVTWKHSSLLSELKCDYAWVWSGGLTLEQCCPEAIKEQFDSVNGRLRAHMLAIKTAKVDLETNCFFDLIPSDLMHQYFDIKDKICKSVLEGKQVKNYDFLKQVHIMLEEISNYDLNLDPSNINHLRYRTRTREFLRRLEQVQKRIQLEVFGSKTGRLTTRRGTFPILNISRDHRSILRPINDVFVELDFNSAEARTFLALSGKRDIEGDIHKWNLENVENNSATREQMKERFFAWLYNPESKDTALDKLYNKEAIKVDFWDGEYVTNPFGRKIATDDRRCINYLIQSTTNDIVLENALKIRQMLQQCKSRICFTLHDSVIIDFSKQDKNLLMSIVKVFEKTRLGYFKANVKMGKDFGNMKDIKIA
tara:strand:+ start:13784 stop:14977 length:1194 start_codon:yes stop_codon:yes gene_type:complete